MRITPGRVATLILIFVLNPLTVGIVTGWLVGVSREPVFAIVIPLVFGLLGVLGVGTAAKLIGISTITEFFSALVQLKREPEAASAGSTSSPHIDFVLLALLSFSSLCYCGSFLATAKYVYPFRVPRYQSVSSLLKQRQPLPHEMAQLYRMRFSLFNMGYEDKDYSRIMAECALPVLFPTAERPKETDELVNLSLDQSIKRLTGHAAFVSGLAAVAAPAAAPAEAPQPPVETAPKPAT